MADDPPRQEPEPAPLGPALGGNVRYHVQSGGTVFELEEPDGTVVRIPLNRRTELLLRLPDLSPERTPEQIASDLAAIEVIAAGAPEDEAKAWAVNVRYVRRLLANGRVDDARHRMTWLEPLALTRAAREWGHRKSVAARQPSPWPALAAALAESNPHRSARAALLSVPPRAEEPPG